MTQLGWPLKFGVFMGPIHSPTENPALALRRDLELIRHMDELGYDEAWIGEHHSTGWEFVGSPEVFVAYSAPQTQRIRYGLGVVTLPYHHPFHVAERITLLNYLTGGRVSLGVGPGVLPWDAAMFGLDPMDLRRMMEESLEVVLALLRGERVTRSAEHFQLFDAKLQLRPGDIEVATTSVGSPNGARLSGRLGTSMLSLSSTLATATAGLAAQWQVVEEESALHGQTPDRRKWRLTGPMHVAPTEAQARHETGEGLLEWARYVRDVTGTLEIIPKGSSDEEAIDAMIASGFAVIGTPDQAIAQIERLVEASGGFGTFLLWAHDWASRDATLRSYELFARHVMPAFQDVSPGLLEAEEWAVANASLLGRYQASRSQAIADYAQERERRTTA